MSLTNKQILLNPIYCLAFGLGTGLSPKAPGTVGTVIAIPLFWAIAHWPIWAMLLLIVAMTLIGIYLCGETARALHMHDHPGIVWDEIVGYLIAMLPLSGDWRAIILGFVLFRFFDIVKPWPIGAIDKAVKGGLGIMLDDIIAGLMAALVGGLAWHYASVYQILF
ncbi:phosphatidylglycerophosphatase A family protein [Pleionea sediminis]|uniref:phosphatidylglycerophosphatase A family protein n=1 Tax=Pleionea sediminis TaxID=2569479 RepID=UPI0011854D93|nr:phosphatidylglycerophosphatase A [Pleionea sediminis]